MTQAAPQSPQTGTFRADPQRIDAGFNALPLLNAPPNVGFQARNPGQPVAKPPPPPAPDIPVAEVPEPIAIASAPAPHPVLPRRPAADPDALAAARAEGHASGLAEGRAAAEADLAETRSAMAMEAAALARAIGLLETPPQTEVTRLTETLTRAINDLAAERAGHAIDANVAPFASRITQMVNRVMKDAAEVVLHLHPDDLASLRPYLAGVPNGALAQAHLVPDGALRRGDADLRVPGVRVADLIQTEDA